MPRAKNPIADLKALSSKADEIAARQLVLAEAAKSFVGNLAFEAGLDDWDLKDLKAGFSHLAKLGPAGVHKGGKLKSSLPASDTSAVAAE